MYTTTARRVYEDQIPSFMSVFDLDHNMQDSEDQDTVTVVDPKLMDIDSPKLAPDHTTLLQAPSLAPSHQHREIQSTQASESADSSPTTTMSCTDSSSLSDPSPSSSPDSPVNLVPLNAFPGTTFGALPSMVSLTVSENVPRLGRPMTSPAPRRRNMKGLSIQPPFAPSAASSRENSEPPSPSFIKPKIPAMKRKPSNLSLKTDSNDLAGRPTLQFPQSPSIVPKLAQRRALKHSMSSPHMLGGLKSATFAPSGGMTFPTVFERNESGLSSVLRSSNTPAPSQPLCRDEPIKEEESPIRSQMANRFAFDIEPYHEKEANEDQKSPGYPDGPVAIYGDMVYLYLEPTAEEARKFDVVINVAREVHNPFEQAQDVRMGDESPIPDTAATDASFATAFEYQTGDRTPTTPRAMSSAEEPEYIHMLWDHNTDISTDLMHLCEKIEMETHLGKKVLVHCQQGASRSASLIIAYGLYKNPDMSVNDAYYAAQAKSRWISPNMRLMYCLQDFQKQVAMRKLSPKSAFKPKSGRSPSNHRMTLSVDTIEAPKEPRTAPLPEEDPAGPEKTMLRNRGFSSPVQVAVTPGPSSAPSAFSWSQQEDASDPGKFGRFNIATIFTAPTPIDDKTADSQFAAASTSSFLLPNPPRSPGFSSSFSGFLAKPPPSPGFAPSDPFAQPPKSPGFPPPNPFAKPPPSPGFGAHRFGGAKSLGFSPMNFGSFSKKSDDAKPPVERQLQAVNILPENIALLSPRAETMTNNPVHHSYAELSAMRFVDVPPSPSMPFFSPIAETSQDRLFSPRESEFPRGTFSFTPRPRQVSDPRSPPTKGEAPIVRSIDEIL